MAKEFWLLDSQNSRI